MPGYKSYIVIAFLAVLSSVFFSITTQGQIQSRKQIESECYTSEFPILMYHHVRPYTQLNNISARNLSVSPDELDEQMKYFSDTGWKTMHIRDMKGNTVPCKSFLITFDDGYYDIYKYAAPILKKYNYTGIMSLIPAYIDESDYISGNQVRELLGNDWEIASHTWTHPILTKTPVNKLGTEIQKSKTDLEKWFGTTIDVFVYPGGFYNNEALKKTRESRYKFAFTTHQGYTKLGTKNLELKRINIAPGTTVEELQKLLEHEPRQ